MMRHDIKVACAEGRVRWRKHALERIMERGIGRERVKSVLMQGEVIASYLDDCPFPSLLLDGRVHDDVLHVVASFDESDSYCYVITAYHPNLEYFEADLRTRRTS